MENFIYSYAIICLKDFPLVKNRPDIKDFYFDMILHAESVYGIFQIFSPESIDKELEMRKKRFVISFRDIPRLSRLCPQHTFDVEYEGEFSFSDALKEIGEFLDEIYKPREDNK